MNHSHCFLTKSKSPLRPIFSLFPEGVRAELGKRSSELNQLEREEKELRKIRVELSQLEREQRALAGKVMAIKQDITEHTMVLQQQQNATASSPKTEAPMSRPSRHLSATSTKNILKSPLGGNKNAVSKTPGSIEFAASPTLENDQTSKFPERKVAVIKSIRPWDRAKLARYTSRRKVGDFEQICSSYEQTKKDAVSKIPGSIEFDGTKKKTGHNLKLPVPRCCRIEQIASL
jgi:hypothetical protein